MKYLTVITLYVTVFNLTVLQAQYTAIPDPYFEEVLIEQGIDTEGTLDGQVLTADIAGITELSIGFMAGITDFITDFAGIEDFTSLQVLSLGKIGNENDPMQPLDLTHNTLLTDIVIHHSWIPGIDVSQCAQLKTLRYIHAPYQEVDVSHNGQLEALYLGNPDIDTAPFCDLLQLDTSQNPLLTVLSLPFSHVATLDLYPNPLLRELDVSFCNLPSLDLGQNTALETLYLGRDYGPFMDGIESNQLTSIDLSANAQLAKLDMTATGIAEMDLSGNPQLQFFACAKGFALQSLNLKNGNIGILEDVFVYQTPTLECVMVDDPEGANNNQFPYSNWYVDPPIVYTKNCLLGQESLAGASVAVSPNPVRERLRIRVSRDIPVVVTVYSASGKKVEGYTRSGLRELDVSSLPCGLYFLRAETPAGTFVQKFVKQ